MIVLEILIVTVFATVALTMFSYILSFWLLYNFKEPQILAMLVHKLRIDAYSANITGWILHFTAGLAFVLCYRFWWFSHAALMTYTWAVMFGLVSGIVAIIIWALTFRLHPRHIKLNKIVFYIQLLPAHIVFSVSAFFIYKNFFIQY